MPSADDSNSSPIAQQAETARLGIGHDMRALRHVVENGGAPVTPSLANTAMVLSTHIARVSDSLPLAQSVDDVQGPDLTQYKQQAKLIFRKLTPSSETRCSIDSGPMSLHYLVHPPPSDPSSVVYLTITEASYPRKLAFSYLDELAREFEMSYGRQILQRTLRPYAFVAFDTFMQRTKRLYADSRTAESTAGSHLDKLNEDLQDVQKIMTKNMEDLLWRGDSLDRTCALTDACRHVDALLVAARRVAQIPPCGPKNQRRCYDSQIRSVRMHG